MAKVDPEQTLFGAYGAVVIGALFFSFLADIGYLGPTLRSDVHAEMWVLKGDVQPLSDAGGKDVLEKRMENDQLGPTTPTAAPSNTPTRLPYGSPRYDPSF